jgi:hypothetical protein
VVIDNGNRFGSNDNSDDLAAIQAALEKWQRTVNAAPDEEMGGLSPDTVYRLLYEPWGKPQSIIQFQADLPTEELTGAIIYRRARWLLDRIQAAGGVKATPKGNLTRSIVAEFLTDSEMDPESYAPHLVSKSVNEEDFFPLHTAKLACRCAGLLLLRKGRLTVTTTGTRLLGQDKAGALFLRLFTAVFRKFNLAYAYRQYLDAPSLQQCAGYTLHRLGAKARDWRSPEELYPNVFLPSVRAQLETELAGKQWVTPTESAADRIFTPLIDFGLLEGRNEERQGVEFLAAVRITPLFRHALVFNDLAGT